MQLLRLRRVDLPGALGRCSVTAMALVAAAGVYPACPESAIQCHWHDEWRSK
jgi:hypothetical protein